jgi:hypothetical protein
MKHSELGMRAYFLQNKQYTKGYTEYLEVFLNNRYNLLFDESNLPPILLNNINYFIKLVNVFGHQKLGFRDKYIFTKYLRNNYFRKLLRNNFLKKNLFNYRFLKSHIYFKNFFSVKFLKFFFYYNFSHYKSLLKKFKNNYNFLGITYFKLIFDFVYNKKYKYPINIYNKKFENNNKLKELKNNYNLLYNLKSKKLKFIKKFFNFELYKKRFLEKVNMEEIYLNKGKKYYNKRDFFRYLKKEEIYLKGKENIIIEKKINKNLNFNKDLLKRFQNFIISNISIYLEFVKNCLSEKIFNKYLIAIKDFFILNYEYKLSYISPIFFFTQSKILHYYHIYITIIKKIKKKLNKEQNKIFTLFLSKEIAVNSNLQQKSNYKSYMFLPFSFYNSYIIKLFYLKFIKFIKFFILKKNIKFYDSNIFFHFKSFFQIIYLKYKKKSFKKFRYLKKLDNFYHKKKIYCINFLKKNKRYDYLFFFKILLIKFYYYKLKKFYQLYATDKNLNKLLKKKFTLKIFIINKLNIFIQKIMKKFNFNKLFNIKSLLYKFSNKKFNILINFIKKNKKFKIL